jgi:DNA integrity scanning protein DisA with diadenylate cyclase activity
VGPFFNHLLFLTTWVFQILWQVLLILLLILFQSEIRQVLEKVSPLRYLRSRRRDYGGTFAANLTGVLFELAAEKTGALVVLTRDDNPSQLIHAGQQVMAIPDPMLIKSIFNHHAPAHDGAVIISQDRLTHMGCILPLSESQDLPEQYGTRHRAALGLSEVTDAVCLVVSEERSEVASIVAGEIELWNQPEDLQGQLKEWLGGPEIQVPTVQRFLEDFFIHNWKKKLVAFALVSTCWLVLASHQKEERKQMTSLRPASSGGQAEDRGQMTEERGQKTEDRRQRTEDRGQKTEDRKQMR